MKLIQSIFAFALLFFFVNCTAWPGLIPIQSGSKKSTIYPIPLPGTTTTPALRITAPNGSGVQTFFSSYGMINAANKQLGAIDSSGADVTSAITTWVSSDPTVADFVGVPGNITAANAPKVGTTIVTATHPTLSTATLTIGVNATGTAPSILAFDGKNFIQLSGSTQNPSEEK